LSYYEALTEEYNSEFDDSPSAVAGRDETRLRANSSSAIELTDYDLALVLGALEEAAHDLFGNSLVSSAKSKDYKHSRIRVQLSRPLKTAEIEKLTTDHHVIGGRLNVTRRDDDGFLFKLRVSPKGTHVWADADVPSRLLFEVIAAALDAHFVNVYPTAVRTFTEYHA